MNKDRLRRRSVNKPPHQRARSYFSLDSSVAKETTKGRALMLKTMEVSRWFSTRHSGDAEQKRSCIRKSVLELKLLRKEFKSLSAVKIH